MLVYLFSSIFAKGMINNADKMLSEGKKEKMFK